MPGFSSIMCQIRLNSWSNTVTVEHCVMYWTIKLIREVSYMTSYTYSSIAVHYIGHDKTNSGRMSISWPVCELFLEVLVENGTKESTASEMFSWSLWLLADCQVSMEDYDLSANTVLHKLGNFKEKVVPQHCSCACL